MKVRDVTFFVSLDRMHRQEGRAMKTRDAAILASLDRMSSLSDEEIKKVEKIQERIAARLTVIKDSPMTPEEELVIDLVVMETYLELKAH